MLKLGDVMEISSMALATIIEIILHATLAGKETAGGTEAILERNNPQASYSAGRQACTRCSASTTSSAVIRTAISLRRISGQLRPCAAASDSQT